MTPHPVPPKSEGAAIMSAMRDHEDIARRVADCLEQHGEAFGIQPYRYDSGEHKGVDASFYDDHSEIHLFGPDQGRPCFKLVVTREKDVR